MYALYPILIYKNLESFAENNEDILRFASTLLPSALMLRKVWVILSDSRYMMMSHGRLKTERMEQRAQRNSAQNSVNADLDADIDVDVNADLPGFSDKSTNVQSREKFQMRFRIAPSVEAYISDERFVYSSSSSSSASSTSVTAGSESEIDTALDSESIMKSNITKACFRHYCHQCVVAFVGMCLIAYGVAAIAGNEIYFHNHSNYCNMAARYDPNPNPNQSSDDYTNNEMPFTFEEINRTLYAEPELSIYKFCRFQVYPYFTTNVNNVHHCNCREFSMRFPFRLQYFENFTLDQKAFTKSVVENALQKWDNLVIFTVSTHTLDVNGFNLTKDVIATSSQYLRMFAVENLIIPYIDNHTFSRWSLLGSLTLSGTTAWTFPTESAGKHLKQLQSFDYRVGGMTDIEWMCELIKLKSIVMVFTSITYIPTCFESKSKFSNLEVFVIGLSAVAQFSAAIFDLPKLRLVGAPGSFIHSFTKSTSTSVVNTATAKPNVEYYFGSTPLCDTYNAMLADPNNTQITYYTDSSQSLLNETELNRFFDASQACWVPCPEANAVENAVCWQMMHSDGWCTDACFTAHCDYDNLDCVQMCGVDAESANCDPQLMLNNGVCNEECNTETCKYDLYDCVERKTYPLCNSACEQSWIGDGWCDANCASDVRCANDAGDCQTCSGVCSSVVQFYMDIGANLITPDNVMTLDELCSAYPSLKMFILSAETIAAVNDNCNQLFALYDRNSNGMLGFEELTFIYSLNQFRVNKSSQASCIGCFLDISPVVYHL
jgi:hypothetical protein